MQWPEAVRRDVGGLESLSDFISLPRDEEGCPIIPTPRVMALIEAKEAWATELGTLDAVPRSITRGQLVTLRIAAPSQQRRCVTTRRGRRTRMPSGRWARHCKWLVTGVLAYAAWDDRMPVLLQPCGAVPKGTAPFYGPITDARFANLLYSDWG